MLPERRLRRAPGAREVPEHSASPRDRQSKARAGRTVKVRLLGSPALMGGTCRCANHTLFQAQTARSRLMGGIQALG
jgi:hypothetical protein